MTDKKPIKVGGLMRCCVQTYREYDGPEHEGTVLLCKWCSDSMIVKDGVWQWNR